MAIYTYQCPLCGEIKEKLMRSQDYTPVCTNLDCVAWTPVPALMTRILSIPSPMQWGCRKGF
jgi:hypothetical protein